ncbi:MAG: carboxymethylenebutenolidase [Acidimicrobiia bacterium]|nr:carboxymethylenebutenolidase [Acidimicrobiia bacterium]
MAFKDYLAGEVGLDFHDGLLSRREALRRLGLMGLSVTAATTLLAACGSSSSSSSTTAATSASTTANPGTGTTASSSPATSSATTAAQPITFAGPAGQLQGVWSAAAQPKGAVLIIHENQGLTAHFTKLPARFAASGYNALALDLLSRQGGTAAIADTGQVAAALSNAQQADLVADMQAALTEVARRSPSAKLAVVGFCFGGGQVWSLLNAGEPRLAAAVPFYGPGVSSPDFSRSKAAVLGVYGEKDSRVNGTRDAMDAALTNAGLTHEMRTFPGADHAFFNDTGTRYDAIQAAAAYQATLDWFARYLT